MSGDARGGKCPGGKCPFTKSSTHAKRFSVEYEVVLGEGYCLTDYIVTDTARSLITATVFHTAPAFQTCNTYICEICKFLYCLGLCMRVYAYLNVNRCLHQLRLLQPAACEQGYTDVDQEQLMHALSMNRLIHSSTIDRSRGHQICSTSLKNLTL
jgi:hypothetical protein